MTRAVKEWVASHDDQAIPARVKERVFTRAGGRCAECGRPIAGSVRPAYDHIIPLIAGGRHAEGNMQLLCVSPCHAEKTRADVSEKSLVARKRKKHLGIKKPRTMTQWRRFDGTIVTAARTRS